MKYLITGGCGFLGSNLARKILDESDDDLFVVDNLYREGSKKNLEWLKTFGVFDYFHIDIRNHAAVERVIKTVKPDVIFHLAGQVAMSSSISDPKFDFDVNAGGTLNLLESVRKNSVDSAVIFSSTNKVYGDLVDLRYVEHTTRYQAIDYPDGFNEELKLDFHTPYGCSKGTADQYMLDYARIFGLKTVVFRHSSIFGERQYPTFSQGWVGWFCQNALETKMGRLDNFTIAGDGKQVRDVLHINDATRLYLEVSKQIDVVKGQAFNIGGGMKNSLSLLELFDILETELELYLSFKKLPWRISDQKVFVADNSKIRKMLNWSPRIGKNEGIKRMLDWESLRKNSTLNTLHTNGPFH